MSSVENVSISDSNPKVQSEQIAGLVRAPVFPDSYAEDLVAAFDAEELPAAPDDAAVLQRLFASAELLYAHQEYAEALVLLRNIVMRSPTHVDAIERMGDCLRRLERYGEALTCFRSLVKMRPGAASWFRLAEVYYLLERDDDAMAGFQKASQDGEACEPWLFEIYKNMGNIFVRAGDFEAAEENYNKAYTLNAASDALMVNYGTLEVQRENFSEALSRFRRAIEINSGNDRGWVGLALMHRYMGDLELSWANLERSLDLNIKNKTALRLLVDWAVADHRVDRAISRLQDYLSAGNQDIDMSVQLAKLFFYTNRAFEGEIELARSLAIDAANPEAVAMAGALRSQRLTA